MPKDIQTSLTFRCGECNRKLIEVRDKPEDKFYDLRCTKCDSDLREKEGW